MRMPKMSGPDACAVIRQTSNVPVIMFTSSNDASEVKDAIQKGATDFVLKQTGVSELTERIAFHISKVTPAITPAKPVPLEQIVKTVPATPPAQTKTTTLIIDPDEKSRDVIKAVLTRLNQNSIEASSAADAIREFKQNKPDIVVTEWSLPDMDAFTMLSELKRGRNEPELIKLIMSKRLSPEAQRKARFHGITDFLTKPFNGAKVEVLVADSVRKSLRGLRSKKRKAA